jgi:putative OPT family oligopeptide transporter
MEQHKPFVPADVQMRDFNPKTVILGVLLGAVFGSANAYLGLRVGLTISTAIPLAVVSVAILRILTPLFGRSTILECNISQTAGSASSSLASGIIFTIPALFLWGYEPSLLQITLLAMCGGVLGVLFMIPLRGFLIVKEHHHLPYPEGTAAAEVLVAASEGGSTAKNVFAGMGIGLIYKGLISLFYLWPSRIMVHLPLIKKAVVGVSATPALLGVGYILGRRIGTIMVGGGLVSWVLIIPIIAWKFGDAEIWPNTLKYLQSRDPGLTATLIGELSAKQIWEGYIRIIGAGAVAAAGIITVVRSIPTMVASLRIGVKELRSSAAGLDMGRLRTERDLSIKWVLLGVVVVVLAVTGVKGIIGHDTGLVMRFCSALCIAFFAFCFVTVSSRIVGLVGVSSNPTSGMAIVTLLGTGIVFQLLGWTDLTGKITALTIGTIVCIAASIAGDISQDLKAGFLIGATPRKQQISELIGATGSAFFVALAVYYLGKAYGFGTEALPAPQATLMKTVLDGVLDANLRWELIGIGAVFAVLVLFLKVPPLPFAVGMYLPLYTMTPVFIGGMIRHFIEKKYGADKDKTEKGKDQGILLGSGFIAGEGLMGVVIAVLAVIMSKTPKFFEIHWAPQWVGQIVSVIFFTILGMFLYRVAARSREK